MEASRHHNAYEADEPTAYGTRNVVPVDLRCECGRLHAGLLGQHIVCECGRSFDTAAVSASQPGEMLSAMATRIRQAARLGGAIVLCSAVAGLWLWGWTGAALGVCVSIAVCIGVLRPWWRGHVSARVMAAGPITVSSRPLADSKAPRE